MTAYGEGEERDLGKPGLGSQWSQVNPAAGYVIDPAEDCAAVGRSLWKVMQHIFIVDLQESRKHNQYRNAGEDQDHLEELLNQAGLYYLDENRDEAMGIKVIIRVR